MNWKNKTMLLILLLCVGFVAQAQKPSKEERREKMEAMKTAYITEKLELSSKEAEVFWPLYRKMQEERKQLGKARKTPPPHNATKGEHKGPNFDEMNDDEINRFIENRFSTQQKKLDLDKKYFNEFKEVLPIKKVAKLLGAEKSFRREVLQKLREEYCQKR